MESVPFISTRGFKILVFWVLFIAAIAGTFVLSRNIEGRAGENAAATFFSSGRTHVVELYRGRAEPSAVTVRRGDEVAFTVMDDSHHNMAEERTDRSDARLQSGELSRGDSYSLVFANPGTISFYDRTDLDIVVTITVK